MSTIYKVFQTLLDAKAPSAQVQKRIFDYAAKNSKGAVLLVKLALHPALDPSVDEELKKITAANVVAARVSRPGRTTEEIWAVLEKEKRVSVLNAIAAQGNLSESAQQTIASNTKHKAVLMSLIMNPAAAFHNRTTAAANYVDYSRGVSDGSMNMKRVDALINIEGTLPGFLEAAAKTTTDIELLYAAARVGDLDADGQHRLVTGFIARYSIGLSVPESSTSYYAGNDAQGQLINIAEELCDSGFIADAARKELVKGLERTSKSFKKGSYMLTQYELMIANVKRAWKNVFLEYSERVDNAKTEEDISKVVADVMNVYNTTDDISRSMLEQFAHKLAASSLTTPELLDDIFDRIHIRNLDKLVTECSSVEKQALAIATNFFFMNDFEDILSKVADPDGLICALINLANTRKLRYGMESLTTSAYFKPEYLKLFSLDLLLEGENSAISADSLLELLEEALGDDQVVEALDTLGNEFAGSVEELLFVAHKI